MTKKADAAVASPIVKVLSVTDRGPVQNLRKTSMEIRNAIVSRYSLFTSNPGFLNMNCQYFLEKNGHSSTLLYPVKIIVPSGDMRGEGG